MVASSSNVQAGQRNATLRLSSTERGQVLTATVPVDLSETDFQRVTRSEHNLVSRLTGCNCLSGRISFVVEHDFNDVIQVNLGPAGGGAD